MKRVRSLGVILGIMVLAAPLVVGPAHAFTGGQTIRIYSGLPPGGGHDIEGRLIARWIGNYLPGKPKSIIKINVPGAGGLIMTTQFYQTAKPDGLTWAIMGTTQTASQALEDPPPNWNLLKMPQVFTHTGPGAAIVRDFLGVRKPADLLKIDGSKIVISGRILGEASSMADVLGLDLLGVKGHKYVVGYAGSAIMARAFFSGEVSYVGGTGLHHALGASGLYHSAIKEGRAFLLWQSGVLTPDGSVVRSPGTDVPTLGEVYQEIHGKPPSGPLWEAYKLTGPATRTLNRYMVLPPGMPPDRVAILRQAFQKLYSNPEFVKEWERIFGLKLDFIPGDGADRVMKSLIESTQGWQFIKTEYIPRLRRATQ
ncbi:MAG TPA: hypothetical protein VMR20_05155 [Verrucomicrobiae bacterium]|nr:hypothetical protein [Verrucomicrobiae bacterium]